MDFLQLRGGADGASIYGNLYCPFFFPLGLVMVPIREEMIQLAQEYKKDKQQLEGRYLISLDMSQISSKIKHGKRTVK